MICRAAGHDHGWYAHGDEVGAGGGKAGGVFRCFDIASDAGDFKNFRPPGDQLEAAVAGRVTVFDVGGDAEGDVVGAFLTDRHGVVAGAPGIDAGDEAGAENFARFAKGRGCGLGRWDVNAIGFDDAGQGGVSRYEGRDALRLDRGYSGGEFGRGKRMFGIGFEDDGCDLSGAGYFGCAAVQVRPGPSDGWEDEYNLSANCVLSH